MILLIDNYDSFTYNLVQRLGEIDAGLELEVHRNDQITLDEIARRRPSHIIVSPGPCTPREAGVSCDVIGRFAPEVPILGVCLGHQSIGHAFGAEIVRAKRLMHGKTDLIEHDARDGSREIMGVRHKRYPLEGVQFHPESFLTRCGSDILRNFLSLSAAA